MPAAVPNRFPLAPPPPPCRPPLPLPECAWRCPTHPCSFNKREQDFGSKQEFDDYLEEREDISERRLPALQGPAALLGS